MDAVILAGGRGTRLRPLTDTIPKPLLLISGKPMLEWSLLSLRPIAGRVWVVVSYLKEQIAAFMQAQHIFNDYQLIEQVPTPLGTGHALQCCAPFLGDSSFLVLNGDDLYSTRSLQSLAAVEFGILTIERKDQARWGVVVTDENGYVVRLHEKPPEGLYPLPVKVNTGAYKFTPTVFECPLELSPRGEFEITDYVTCLANRYYVNAVPAHYWTTVGTHEDYNAVQKLNLEQLLF